VNPFVVIGGIAPTMVLAFLLQRIAILRSLRWPITWRSVLLTPRPPECWLTKGQHHDDEDRATSAS
jgi:hypothetical protein